MIIDHISLPSSDLAPSRAFFGLALAPLRIGVVKEYPGAVGMGRDEPAFWLVAGRLCQPHCTWPSSPPTARRWTPSTPPRCVPAPSTTVRRACARTTTRTTTPPS